MSVESLAEHKSIQDYLSHNDIEQRRWYTSGQYIGGRWVWSSTNAYFAFEQGWLPTVTLYDVGSTLTYAYRLGEWGWLMDQGTEPRPFICEIAISDAWKIVRETRNIGA